MTVWVPKRCSHNFAAAEKYGKIRYILDDDVSPFNLERALEMFMQISGEIGPDDLYIPCGPPAISMLFALNWPWAAMRILMFHARTKDYIERELER